MEPLEKVALFILPIMFFALGVVFGWSIFGI